MNEPNSTIAWRVGELERQVQRLHDLEPAVVKRRVEDMHVDIAEVRDELRGVRRALWACALSVSAGAIVFAATAFHLWGG